MDAFALTEIDAFAGDMRGLPPEANKVHFDAAKFRVVQGMMAECVRIKVGL
jgi:hypothetical protein